MAGCTSFSHLTRITPDGHDGPQAIHCGACHIQQYQEWQGTAHARAFSSKSFQEATDTPEEDGCLRCHSPLGIHKGEAKARSFHRDEGINCISCHLSQGKMHGPHKSSALFSPHPIEQDPFYLTPALCATCHEETYSQWKKVSAGQKIRSCQQCHQCSKQCCVTQGTNLFSNVLVSFEKKVQACNHTITLDMMANFPNGVNITALALNKGKEAPTLSINIHNNLPHDLPTGTFGKKEIQLSLLFMKGDLQVTEKKLLVSDERKALTAGESKKIIFPLTPEESRADTLRLQLERYSTNDPERPPIVLSSKIIAAIHEAFH
ncbi:MAG: multiheme c-type cytochrome [Desulfocapsaceae bacterium]|nr:multiheme c-type cytochrome [Desulfocapsaceae bacterium]